MGIRNLMRGERVEAEVLKIILGIPLESAASLEKRRGKKDWRKRGGTGGEFLEGRYQFLDEQ